MLFCFKKKIRLLGLIANLDRHNPEGQTFDLRSRVEFYVAYNPGRDRNSTTTEYPETTTIRAGDWNGKANYLHSLIHLEVSSVARSFYHSSIP